MVANLKLRNNPLLLANIFTWAALITLNTTFYLFLSIRSKTWVGEFDSYLKGVIENVVLLGVFFFYRYRLDRFRDKETSELIGRVFYVGFVSVALSLVWFLVSVFLQSTFWGNNATWLNSFYLASMLLAINFLTYTFFIFRILIFRQSPKYVVWTWNAFIYVFFASLIFNFFDFPFQSLPYLATLGILVLTSLLFCVNMHWVAYLSTPAKLRNIGILLMISLFGTYFAYLIFFYYNKGIMVYDVGFSVYVVGLVAFVLIYATMAILVLIFNIPTTSVYKKKIDEILAFQQLTQSLQVGSSEQDIYQALLQNALQVTQADAGFLEIKANNQLIAEGTEESNACLICNDLKAKISNYDQLDSLMLLEEAMQGYGSVMIKTLYSKKKEVLGKIVLLKIQEEGFNSEHQDLLETFGKQASISIENYQLLGQVIEKEKLQQELDIAEKVQKSLLPKNLQFHKDIEIFGFSESAKSVGGDYYDIFKVAPHRAYIVIGDVSGKGTSAAFNMAQMKGIFQSLAQLDMSPEYFLLYANQAVSQCFEKASFITITLLLVDAEKKLLTMARAGHCPTLYYNAQTGTVDYIQDKGLGLGIMRNKAYTKFIVTTQMQYHKGDIIFLYTDGISEAKNPQNEEYGYERLKNFFAQNIHLPIQELQSRLIEDVRIFSQGLPPYDDYTCVVMKFV
ncbi:MAG: SpoIIE family protein phosphatase [Raineya sp.]|nr:SpoIIE family protein phosphatase [Raineya sp.]